MIQSVLVLDFGGQYKELIAQAVRQHAVYSEIKPGNTPIDVIRKMKPIGIILSGGPSSVYDDNSPKCDPELFSLGIPILGICYGMQLIVHLMGGEVVAGDIGEYGLAKVKPSRASQLFGNISGAFDAVMSHNDKVQSVPEGFVVSAETENCIAACENVAKKLYCVQFHPETKQTQVGSEILKNFLIDICGATGDYKIDDYVNKQIAQIQKTVGNEKVLLALSGGVDSSVTAAILSKAISKQLICIFVDHGFMRKNEPEEIEEVFSNQDLHFMHVDARERFLSQIKGVSDPEEKRKRIGNTFIKVFEEEAQKLGNIPYLAQGTIYPDLVESGGVYGATIKSHHNVGGLPETLDFKGLIEPLASLFKNEVRVIGQKLGLPQHLLQRQPFPGPGLAIRIIGEITNEKLAVLKEADAIFREEVLKAGDLPDQYFAVLTDTYSVGVKGDDRTYSPVVALRAVTTSDFMTCEYAPLPHKLLSHISSRITNEIKSVSRVVYDITSKPPSTIEWE